MFKPLPPAQIVLAVERSARAERNTERRPIFKWKIAHDCIPIKDRPRRKFNARTLANTHSVLCQFAALCSLCSLW